MSSLRDRVEALLEDVGVESSGKLSDDVKAVADAPAPSPLTLDGLGLGGRPPGLDAPSEAETLQTEISESLSDALR